MTRSLVLVTALVVLVACGASDPRADEVKAPAVAAPDPASQAPADPPAPVDPAPADALPESAPPADVAPEPLDIRAEIALQDTYLSEGRGVEQLARLSAILSAYARLRAGASPGPVDAVPARDPGRAAAHYLRGRILGQLARLQEAKAEFDCALTLDPDLAWAHHGLGVYFNMTRDFAASATALERAIALAPEEPTFTASLAVVYFLIKPPRRDDAERLIARAIELAPRRADLRVTHAEILEVAGKAELARDEYRRAIELDPECLVAYEKRAKLCVDAGQLAEAVAIYKELVSVLRSPAPLANARRTLEYLERHIERKPLVDIASASSSSELAWAMASQRDDVRRAAYRKLADWGYATDLPIFFLGVVDKDDEVRVACVNGLARTGRPEAVPVLVRVLRLDSRFEIRGQAAVALEQVATREIIPDLVPLLRDETDGHVLQTIEGALRQLAGTRLDVVIDPKDLATTRVHVADAWDRWWKAHLEAEKK